MAIAIMATAGGPSMAEYQKIEYRIGKDGKIIETVLNGSGPNCLAATAAIEAELGPIQSREFLPEYHEDDSESLIETTQPLTQA
jgi:Protein of unknown function (DUF2997)